MTTKSTILCDDTIKIVITPKLEKILGRSEATALQQLHFCLTINEINGKTYDDKRWIYNTYDEWHEKYIPHYSSGTIQRAFTKLEKLGIVSSCQLEKNYGNRRKSYTINYYVLDTLIEDYDEKNLPQKSNINTTQSKPPQQIASKSIPKIHPQTDDVPTKVINVYSNIQPILSGNSLQMITVWNEVVGKDLNQNITSYPKLLHTLDALLDNYFDNDCEKWRTYCLKITSSKFLMGEVNDYRIRFSYAISENGLNEILYGDKFTFGDRVTIKTDKPQKSKSTSPFEHYQESEQALKLRAFIQKKVQSTAVYESWYKPTYIYYNTETNEYTLFAATRFMKDRISLMDKEIAGKFSEIRFFNGQYPEEYFSVPVSLENTSEKITHKTQEQSASPNHSLENTETSKIFLTDDNIDDDNNNIHKNTTERYSSNCVYTENSEHDFHTHGEGEGTSSRFQEAENAQQPQQALKEKMFSDLYAAYFEETFVFVDENDKTCLFIKHESQQKPLQTFLTKVNIIFSESSVPPEFLHQYYFSHNAEMEHTSHVIPYPSETYTLGSHFSSPKTVSSLPHKEINEVEGTLLLRSSALSHISNHTDTVGNPPHVSKCYDHHHKMRRWSQQNGMFLTKTFPKITSNIFYFRTIDIRLKNIRFKSKKKKK